MIVRVPTAPTMRLSEENLRKHTVESSKNGRYSPIDRALQDAKQVAELDATLEMFAYDDDDDGADADNADVESVEETNSRNAAKAGTRGLASLDTIIDRFIKMHPLRDSHPWVARNAVEELDLGELVAEIDDIEESQDDVSGDTGSLRASSDTLSISRFRTTAREDKERDKTRWKTRKEQRSENINRTKLARSV